MESIRIQLENEVSDYSLNSNNYSLTFILSVKHFGGQNQISIHLSGFDKDKNEEVDWFNKLIESNQKIILEVVKGGDSVQPKENKLMEESFIDKQKMETYLFLQRELKAKGLL